MDVVHIHKSARRMKPDGSATGPTAVRNLWVGWNLTFAKSYDRGNETYDLLESDRDAIEREVGVTLRWERGDDRVFIGTPHVVFSDLNSTADRQRVITYLADMTQRMIRVFKPCLEAAAQRNSSG